MTCREMAELLVEYLAGELSPEQDAFVQEHLHLCVCCKHFMDSYQITIHLTKKLPCAPMSRDAAARMQAALRQACGDATE